MTVVQLLLTSLLDVMEIPVLENTHLENTHASAFSRLVSPELFVSVTLFEKCRGHGEGRVAAAPGAPAQKEICASAKTTGTGGYTPAFPARWFTAYTRSPR